jgi:3-deoxy-D-manno-octulosonate 8-phosphate phosphatase (KDO 8-P phosphatase)
MIKLLILDIDGVLTSGKKSYGQDGKIISKEFNDKDFTAIKRIKASGIPVVFLSGDKNINESVAQNRNIDFFHSIINGQLNKASFVTVLCRNYRVKPEEIAYVGDDLFDLEIIELVGYKYCPYDAIDDLKNICTVLNRNGGNGVVESLYQSMINDKLIIVPTLANIKTLDSLEKY